VRDPVTIMDVSIGDFDEYVSGRHTLWRDNPVFCGSRYRTAPLYSHQLQFLRCLRLWPRFLDTAPCSRRGSFFLKSPTRSTTWRPDANQGTFPLGQVAWLTCRLVRLYVAQLQTAHPLTLVAYDMDRHLEIDKFLTLYSNRICTHIFRFRTPILAATRRFIIFVRVPYFHPTPFGS